MWYYASDGTAVGPMSHEQIVAAMRAGNVAPSDLVWTAGMSSWQPAGTLPWLSSAPSPLPVPLTSQSTADDEWVRWMIPVGRSPWALAAGYLGLLVFVPFIAPLAAICGVLAIRDIRSRGVCGMGRAVFGIVMGAVGIGVYAAYFLAPVLRG